VLSTVFFKLFAAAEPYTSVKVTHGTPWIDPWFQRRMRGKATGCLRTHFSSRALRTETSWGRQSRQRCPIWNLTALVGSSTLLYSKHDRRGGRWRPLSPATNPENLSCGRFWERHAYKSF